LEIPIFVQAKSGDEVIFNFIKNEKTCRTNRDGKKVCEQKEFPLFEKSGRKYEKKVWNLFVKKSGLTATDETIFLLDSRGNIFDAFCWTNRDGKFSSGEKDDVKNLIKMKSWVGDENNFTEEVCFDSTLLEKEFRIVREFDFTKNEFVDTDSAADFFPSAISGAQKPFPAAEVKFNFEEIYFPPADEKNKSEVEIKISTDLPAENWGNFFVFYNGDKISPVENLNFKIPDVSVLGGFFAIRDIFNENAARFEFNAGENSFKFPGKIGGKVVRKKSTGKVFLDFVFRPDLTLKMARADELQISEILANPVGADSISNAEFIELQALKNVDLKNWKLQIDFDEEIALPAKVLSAGEFLKIETKLKNSNSFAVLRKDQRRFKLNWKSAESGKSLAFFDGEFRATEKPTPGAENIFYEKPKPVKKVKPKKPAKKSAPEIILAKAEKRTKFSAGENAGEIALAPVGRKIIFAGATAPNSKVKIFLHSKLQTFETQTDADGFWRFDFFGKLEAGDHRVDLLISPPNSIPSFQKNLLQFKMQNPLRADEIEKVQIAAVVPNPSGADTTNGETIILKNLENRDGWIRDWNFCTDGKCWRIGNSFFPAGEKVEFRSEKTLKNSAGNLILQNFSGEKVDEIFWTDARDKEIFTPAGRILSVAAVSKIHKKVLRDAEKEAQKTNLISGEIVEFLFPKLRVKVAGEIRDFYFTDDRSTFWREKVLRAGASIYLKIKSENKIADFKIAAPPENLRTEFTKLKIPAASVYNFMFFIATLICILFSVPFFVFKSERN